MSGKTIKRAVWNKVSTAFGLAALFGSFRAAESAFDSGDITNKRIRNNYAQKVDARLKAVSTRRKANRVAKRSRKINRQRH